MNLKYTLAILFLTLNGLVCKASFIGGTSIFAKQISGFEYVVKVEMIRDCSGIPAPNYLPITLEYTIPFFGSSQSPDTLEFSSTTFYPYSSNTNCQVATSTIPGFEKIIYEDTLQIGGNLWGIFLNTCSRMPFTNMSGGCAGNGYYKILGLNNNINNTPTYSNECVIYASGTNSTYNLQAIDPEGDSLSYSFVDPIKDLSSVGFAYNPVLFKAGYSLSSIFGLGGSAMLNSVTGQLVYTIPQIGNYAATVKVNEYRNGILVGSTYRDLLFINQTAIPGPVVVNSSAGLANANYNTLSDAFTSINNGTHQGSITIDIVNNITEPANPTYLLNSGGFSNYSHVTIRPVGGNFIISGSSTMANYRGVIELLDADNITINGDDPNIAGERNLTIQASNIGTSSNYAVIKVMSNLAANTGCTNIGIKNCNLIGSRVSPISALVSSCISLCNFSTTSISSPGFDNDFITIENNIIQRSYYGIYSNSNILGLNNDVAIRKNIIGSAIQDFAVSNYGIYINNTNSVPSASSLLIEQNDIRVGANSLNSTPYSGLFAGIYLIQNNAGTIVRKNNIHQIYQPNGTSAASGISIASSTGNDSIRIENNFISDIVGGKVSNTAGSSNTYGIFITGGLGLKLNNNSINLGTPIVNTGTATFPLTSSLYLGATANLTEFQNNILVNNTKGTLNVNNYGIYCNGPNNINFNTACNNNNYFSINSSFKVGYYNGANQITLANWKAVTLKDTNAQNLLPPFVSNIDLHINTLDPNAFPLSNLGKSVNTVLEDIDGDIRGVIPDIGADEYNINNCSGKPSTAIFSNYLYNLCIADTSTTISPSSIGFAMGISFEWQIASNLNSPFANAGGNTIPNNLKYNVSALPLGTHYLRLSTRCSNSLDTSLSPVVIIVVNPSPSLTASFITAPQVHCFGNSNTTIGATTADTGVVNFVWSAPALSNVMGPNYNVSFLNKNTVFTVTATNVFGCTNSSTLLVEVAPNVGLNAINSSPICSTNSIQLIAFDYFSPVSNFYCTSIPTNVLDEEILNFSIGSFSNNSNCTTDSATGAGSISKRYSNYGNMGQVDTITAGSVINFSATIGTCDTLNYDNGFAIFIDFNQDNDFDDLGEKVYNTETQPALTCVPATVLNGLISVPSNAVNGITRVRIIDAEQYGYLGRPKITGCLSYNYGETEDYLIYIDGGVNRTNYQWLPSISLNNSNIVNPISNTLQSTVYTVIVTSSQGCTNSSSVSVDPISFPKIDSVVNSAGSNTFCPGSAHNLVVATNSTNITNVDWYDSSNFNSVLYNGVSIYAQPQSNTTYAAVVTNSCGKKDTAFTTINIFSNPSLDTIGSGGNIIDSACINQFVKLWATINGGTPPFSYFWFDISNNYVNIGQTDTIGYYVSAQNQVGVVISDACGNQTIGYPSFNYIGNSSNITMQVYDNSICHNDSLFLVLSGAKKANWSLNNNLTIASGPTFLKYLPQTSGLIATYAENSYGCPAYFYSQFSYDDLTLDANASPTSIMSNNGQSILSILDQSKPSNYCSQVSGNCANEYISLVSLVANSGFDTLSQSQCSSNGFTDYTNSVIERNLTLNENFSFRIGANTLNTNNQLEAYVDYNGDGLFLGNEERLSLVYFNLIGQNYVYYAGSVVPPNAKLGKTIMRVKYSRNGITDACDTLNIETEDYLLNILPDSNTKFKWYSNAGLIDSGLQINVTPTISTVYTVVSTTSNLCTQSSTVLVTVQNLNLNINASLNSVCVGNAVTLNVTGASTYTWQPGNLIGSSIVVNPLLTTTYTVYGSDISGFSASTTKLITVSPRPTITATATPADYNCSGTAVTLTAAGASTYTISNGITSGVSFTPTATNTYTITGTSMNGCTSTFGKVIGSGPCNACGNNIVISTTPYSVLLQESSTYIKTQGTVAVNNNTWTVLDAAANSYVLLQPGFVAHTGSTFIAQALNGCTAAAPQIPLAEQVNYSGIIVYPNPTTGFVVVEHPNTLSQLDIYDIVGKKVLHLNLAEGATTSEIDLSKLPNGIYILKAINYPNIKIIKQ
jgi:hypothetical protein